MDNPARNVRFQFITLKIILVINMISVIDFIVKLPVITLKIHDIHKYDLGFSFDMVSFSLYIRPIYLVAGSLGNNRKSKHV